MEIYGKRYTTPDLRRRIGNADQLAGIQLVQLDNGPERPGRAAIFHTGSGLNFMVYLDRCLDIASASFCGRPMGWRATPGDIAPQYYEAEGTRWLRSYFGGMVTTCGLCHVGAPKPESALVGNGLHGRIGNTPARDVCVKQEWEGDDYVLSVSGTMREAVLFGENLSLRRTVWTKLGERRFWIRDIVTNEGFNLTPFMLLYHCNVGWPAVDEGSELIAPSRRVAPRDENARDGKEDWWRVDPPAHDYSEKVYYHDMAADKQNMVTAAVVNNGFERGEGFGVYVRYNTEQLPRFVQWKQLGEQDYTVGLEPCNCGVEGRDVDEELGLLHRLAAGESRTFELEIGPVTTDEEIAALRKAAAAAKPKLVDHYSQFVRRPGK